MHFTTQNIQKSMYNVASPTNPRPSPPKRGLARGRVGKLSSTRTPVNLRPMRLGRDPCSPDQWGGSDVSLALGSSIPLANSQTTEL